MDCHRLLFDLTTWVERILKTGNETVTRSKLDDFLISQRYICVSVYLVRLYRLDGIGGNLEGAGAQSSNWQSRSSNTRTHAHTHSTQNSIRPSFGDRIFIVRSPCVVILCAGYLCALAAALVCSRRRVSAGNQAEISHSKPKSKASRRTGGRASKKAGKQRQREEVEARSNRRFRLRLLFACVVVVVVVHYFSRLLFHFIRPLAGLLGRSFVRTFVRLAKKENPRQS